jgi:Trypsin
MKTVAKKLLGLLLVVATLLLASCSQAPTPGDDTLEPQLIGGSIATAGAYPWTAQIWHSTSSGLYLECGGVLLAESWVVTAASCVYDDPTTYRVVLGDHRPAVSEGSEQNMDVMNIIKHPGYSSGSDDYDLALLELGTPATLNTRVATATLADVPALSTVMRVAGWGGSDGSGYAMTDRLNFISVARARSSLCGFDETISVSRFCAASSSLSRRLAFNDKGDPIFMPSTAQVVGIAGSRSFTPSRYQQFTRLYPFRDWINSYTNPPIFFNPCVYSRLCDFPYDIRRIPWDDCRVCDFDLSVFEEYFRIRVSVPDLGINPQEYANVFSFQLLNAAGKVLAEGKGNGQEPMLELSVPLPKGNYKLRVTILDQSVAKLMHSSDKYAFSFGFAFAK